MAEEPIRQLMPVYIPMDELGTEQLSLGGALLEGDVLRIQLNNTVGVAILKRMLAAGKPLAVSFTSMEDKERIRNAHAMRESVEELLEDGAIQELEEKSE